MTERPDLRQLARDIRAALVDYDREALLDMLAHVFEEYVVAGAPAVLLGRSDTVDELAQLSFPELIRTLQTRMAHPELELFRVEDDVVLVRAGGALVPLTEDQVPPRGRPAPVAPAREAREVPGVTGARASADEASARGRGDLAGGTQGVITPPEPRRAPRPHGGVSIAARPTAGETAAAEAPRAAPPRAEDTPGPDGGDEKAPEGDDAASIRFSLLELD